MSVVLVLASLNTIFLESTPSGSLLTEIIWALIFYFLRESSVFGFFKIWVFFLGEISWDAVLASNI